MSEKRVLIGVSIAASVLLCLYFEYLMVLFVVINLFVGYDTYYMVNKLKLNRLVCVLFFLLMTLFNVYLWATYHNRPVFFLKVAFITQVSDVYQYITGVHWGKNKIGWISKNKSYEGYIVGFLLTIVTFLPILIFMDWYKLNTDNILFNDWFYMYFGLCINCFLDCSAIYLLGVIGGLCSSLFKRLANIKDYSDLLGPHGGWIDRIDSIILPLIILYDLSN